MSHWIAGDHSGVFHLETPRSEFFARRSFETLCGVEGELKRLWPEDMLFEVQLCKECIEASGRKVEPSYATVLLPSAEKPARKIVLIPSITAAVLFVAYWIARWLT
jgi:hypothetical protein